MQNNNVVEQLYVEYHDELVEMANSICGNICIESEDMVQDLYLSLLEDEELLESAIDNDGCFDKGFIYLTLKAKLTKIISCNCLVVTE